jgi:hypothetical protein
MPISPSPSPWYLGLSLGPLELASISPTWNGFTEVKWKVILPCSKASIHCSGVFSLVSSDYRHVSCFLGLRALVRGLYKTSVYTYD